MTDPNSDELSRARTLAAMTTDSSTAPAAPADDARSGLPNPGASQAARDRVKRYGKLAKHGIAWSFLREGVGEMMTTPTAIIMARLLSPYDFGIAASAGFFLALATRLTNLGFNQALVRVRTLKPEHTSSVFIISLIVGLIAYPTLTLSAGWMAAYFRAPELAQVMPIAALTFLISPFGTVPAALMNRRLEYRRSAAADWVGSIAESVTAIGFAWAGYGFWSLVYCRVAGDVVNTSAKIILGRWRPSLRFSRAAAGELFSFGSGVFAKRLLDYSAKNLDNLVVGRALGITTLGFYDKAFMTMNKAITRLNAGGPTVSFRVFAIIYEEPERFRKAYSRVVLGACLVGYPLLIGLAAAGPDLIVVMYGQRWAPAIAPFRILCVAGALKVLNEYAGTAVQAWGKVWGQVWRQIIYSGLIVLFVMLLSPWGLTGAAWGVLIATLGMTLLMNGMLMRIASMNLRGVIAPQVPGGVAALVVAAAIVVTQWTGHRVGGGMPQVAVLGAQAAAGALAFAAFLKFNRFREVRTLVRDVAVDLSPPLARIVRLLA